MCTHMSDPLLTVSAHVRPTADCVNNVQKVVEHVLGREVMPTEHLLGEHLGNKKRKYGRAANTVMKTLLATERWHKSGDYYGPSR